MTRPLVKPIRPEFSSGPCAKRPGWSLNVLQQSSLGRSHRHKDCKNKLKKVIELSKSILNIPDDYLVGIVPGSDTGAIEIAMWNLLGVKPVTMLVWDSFGADWAKDIQLQLKLKNLDILKVDFGKLPNLNCINFKGDIVFNWNGTTAGVCVPNADWIKNSRDGLTICDATSAAFAMDIDWSKLDVGTFSWQKSLGGEAGHGMIIHSPKAVQRINTHNPNWPIPKLFQLKKVIELSKSILNIPDDYLVGIVPGSDTGAIEMAMWNLLGAKPVTMLVWDSFGADWAKDIQLQLKIGSYHQIGWVSCVKIIRIYQIHQYV